MTNSKIGTGQLVILLCLSRLCNFLNYVPAFSDPIEGKSMLYGTVIALFLNGLLLIPVLMLNKRFPGENILDITYKKSKFIGTLLSLFLFLLSLVILIGTVVGFEYFMTNAVYVNASIIVIIITMCVACFFGAQSGLEGLARASGIIFVAFLAGAIFIAVASVPLVDLLNIKPIIESPIASSIKYGLELTSKNAELYVFILLIPRTRGNIIKAAIGYLLLSFMLIFATNFLIQSVLGDYFSSQTFPYYTLTTIVETKIFQRLDAIHMTLWVFISFIRISLFMLMANYSLRYILPKKTKKISLPLILIVSIFAACLIGNSTQSLNDISVKTPWIIISLVTIVPMILLFITPRREKNHESKEACTITLDCD